MARKLGDVAIALIILIACITAFSSFIYNADITLNIDSGELGDTFTNIKSNLSGVRIMERNIIGSVDNTSLLVNDEETEKESSADESLGQINRRSKNIIITFFREIKNKVPGANFVIGILTSIIGIIITIVLIRTWRGETKI